MTEALARVGRGGSLPIVRTFESPRFRLIVATTLAVAGIALSAARLFAFDMADPSVALDFVAYHTAAERMLAGDSPYQAAQMAYLYPPFFAQVISPIALLPLEVAKVVWFFGGYLAAFVSTWLATGIGGAQRSLERAVWCLVAVLLFDVVASAIWVGNVGTLVALGITLVAMGGVAAGVGGALVTLLKVIPGTLLPALLVAGRDSRRALAITLGVVAGTLFLLAPQAWLDYPAVLWRLFTNPASTDLNLSVSQVVSSWGWGPDAVLVTRVAMLSVGAGCIVISAWLARQQGGMPAAALLGTVAMLIIPGTLWFHYLAVLLPFGAMAWPRASGGVRGLLLLSAAAVGITPYVNQVLLVHVGSASMLILAGWVLWPRSRPDALAGQRVLQKESA